MPCALEQGWRCRRSYSLTHRSGPALQESVWTTAEQGDARQGKCARLQGIDPSVLPESHAAQAEVRAEAPPGVPGEQAPEAPDGADAAVTAPIVTQRISAMLAREGGGPTASGHGPVAFRSTLAVVQALIEGVETGFKMHGEKALRQNCGGILAKDEAYGFAYVDLMHGKLAPRGNGPLCAIPLGEKLRKLNRKRQDEYDKKKRAAGKEPAVKRAASFAGVEAWHRSKLGEDCAAELAPFLPSPSRCIAVEREEIKREEARPLKAEPGPAPVTPPGPAPSVTSLDVLQDAAEAAWGKVKRLRAECSEGWEKAERFRKALERRGEPQPPPRARGGASMLAEDLSLEEFAARSKAFDERRDAYLSELREYSRKRNEYKDMISSLQLLARDADAALSAWEAADALYEQRKATLFAELKAAEMQAAFAEMLLQRDREATRAKLLADAEKVWGPDHASRPPLATYKL